MVNVGSSPIELSNAELEKGEVFQDLNLDIKKVDEREYTHEDGGSMQSDVFRVLEDTADKRKNLDSKNLKITPDEAFALIGFRPKRSVSHSKLYELATEYYDKKVKKGSKEIQDTLDYIKYNRDDIYSRNSLDENLYKLETIPTKGDIFDIIYEHQENIKKQYGISNKPSKKKKYGGDIMKYQNGSSPYPYNDDYSKMINLQRWFNQLQTIGYTGGKNIKDIQDFLAKNYTGLVQDYMAFRGIPDTNKGKQLRKEGYYTPVDAFTDGLWWYRSLLPYTKYFKTEEEKNTFIKDMVAVS